MAEQRIKGQEVQVLLVVNGEVKDTITEVQNCEFVRELETTEEGYLGEKSNRYDEFYKGYSGNMDLHFSTPDVFDLMQSIQDRAQRRAPGTQINIKATLEFPSGLRRRLLFQNAFFEGMPMSFGGRTEYGTIKLSFKGSDNRVI